MQPWMVGATLVFSAANLAATVSQISPASFSNLDLGDGAVLHDNPLGGTWHDNPLMGSAVSTPRDSPRPPRLILPGDTAAGRAPSALVRVCVCPATGPSGHFLPGCVVHLQLRCNLHRPLMHAPIPSNTQEVQEFFNPQAHVDTVCTTHTDCQEDSAQCQSDTMQTGFSAGCQ